MSAISTETPGRTRPKASTEQAAESLALHQADTQLEPLPADVFESIVAALAEALVIDYLADQQVTNAQKASVVSPSRPEPPLLADAGESRRASRRKVVAVDSRGATTVKGQ